MREGTLIISLDFELHWGVFRTVAAGSHYMRNIYNTPQVVQSILQIFSERKVSATWAVVGLLFAASRSMIEEFSPDVKPEYEYPEYNPYQLSIGKDEIEDPLHYAPSLIKKIQLVPDQEIATHTFSHFLSREDNVTINAFISDMESAIKISEVSGIRIRCIVFPKNRLIKEFIDLLPQLGINVYRGAEKGWMYNKVCSLHDKKPLRISELLNKFGRLLDTYFPITGSNTWGIDELIVEPGKAVNIPASRFLRPYNPALKYLEWVKCRRIKSQIEYAARNGRMVHLRWHPHNFGSNIDRNIMLLNEVLDCYEKCRQKYNMKSMTMSAFADSILKTACDRPLQLDSGN
jgi:hypothetical protein